MGTLANSEDPHEMPNKGGGKFAGGNMRSSVNRKYVMSPFFAVRQIYILNISLANQQLMTILLSFSNATY